MRTFVQEPAWPRPRARRTSAGSPVSGPAPSAVEVEGESGPARLPFDFSRIPVSAPGDPHEQEAERVSGQVMSLRPGQGGERLQRKSAGAAGLNPSAVPPIVHQVLRSPGQPLDPATRAFMEPRFGHDLSSVRVHADEKADAASAAVHARAFTVGSDIVFRRGEHAPNTQSGRALLAHELAHTIQQRGGGPAGLSAAPPGIARQAAKGPSLSEQADTLKRMYSRLVADTDREGRDGIVFVITHKGTWLEPTSMEKTGERKERPSGMSPISEAEALKKLDVYLALVLDSPPAAWKFEFRRDRRGVLQSQGWTRLDEATSPAPPAPAQVTARAECDEESVDYGQCVADERKRAYQQGIQAAGEVAEAFYDPTSGPPGGPGAVLKLPSQMERLRKIREAAKSRTLRHSGAGVRYTVVGPHNKLKGTSVYVLKDVDGNVLYVGKGEALDRLRSHIADPNKTQWFGEIGKVEVRATGLNNTQALALEEELIGQLRPLHNVDRNPFQKEFRGSLELAPNLPAAQKTLHFMIEWGH